jgi:hypothetical protein
VFLKKAVQTLDTQRWIVRRMLYAWSLQKTDATSTKWEGKHLAEHVKKMGEAYEMLGQILYTWANYDGRKKAHQANSIVLMAAREWLHPNYAGTQSEPLADLQVMIESIINPNVLPLPVVVPEVKEASNAPAVAVVVPDPAMTVAVVVPADAPNAQEMLFAVAEVLFTTCTTHFVSDCVFFCIL